MKNPIKKAALSSIVINIILLISFLYVGKCLRFSDFEGIYETLERGNQQMRTDNIKYIESANPILSKKPELNWILQNEFCLNRIEVDSFVQRVDSLMNVNVDISNEDMNDIFLDYNTRLYELYDLYKRHLSSAQKIAKLVDAELNMKIENFYNNAIYWNQFKKEDIISLSDEEKRTLLVGMKSDLIQVETTANHDFLGLVGGRGMMRLNRFFPVAFSDINVINLGEFYEMKVGILTGVLDHNRDRFAVSINNKKINFNNYSKGLIELRNTSLGKKKIEAIVRWSDDSSKGYGIDTSYHYYTVTP